MGDRPNSSPVPTETTHPRYQWDPNPRPKRLRSRGQIQALRLRGYCYRLHWLSFVLSGFRCGVNVIVALLGCYAAQHPKDRIYGYHSNGKGIRADSNIYLKPIHISLIVAVVVVVANAAAVCIPSTHRNNETELLVCLLSKSWAGTAQSV